MSTVYQAKPFQSNTTNKQSFRIIGSLDIDGKGILHSLHDVDPFLFLDETQLSGDEPWPFPKHPHSGLVAIAYLLEGEMIPWDNRNGRAAFNNRAGGLYWVSAGRGIVHEEEPIYHHGPLRWLQLWVNPGLVLSDRKAAVVGLIDPERIPVIDDVTGRVRVLFGSFGGAHNNPPFAWPILYLHIQVKPGCSRIMDAFDPSWHAFAYILGGDGQIDGLNVMVRDCIVFDNHESFQIVNAGTEILDLIFAAGLPHHQAFFKLLGGGGTVVEPTEADAREAMARFEQTGLRFGLD